MNLIDWNMWLANVGGLVHEALTWLLMACLAAGAITAYVRGQLEST